MHKLSSKEQILVSVARIEEHLRSAYRQLGRTAPAHIDVFLCVACDTGAAIASNSTTGEIIVGDGCPDCGRPFAGAWVLWLSKMTARKGGQPS
jgi:hypothetical protein